MKKKAAVKRAPIKCDPQSVRGKLYEMALTRNNVTAMIFLAKSELGLSDRPDLMIKARTLHSNRCKPFDQQDGFNADEYVEQQSRLGELVQNDSVINARIEALQKQAATEGTEGQEGEGGG